MLSHATLTSKSQTIDHPKPRSPEKLWGFIDPGEVLVKDWQKHFDVTPLVELIDKYADVHVEWTDVLDRDLCGCRDGLWYMMHGPWRHAYFETFESAIYARLTYRPWYQAWLLRELELLPRLGAYCTPGEWGDPNFREGHKLLVGQFPHTDYRPYLSSPGVNRGVLAKLYAVPIETIREAMIARHRNRGPWPHPPRFFGIKDGRWQLYGGVHENEWEGYQEAFDSWVAFRRKCMEARYGAR